MSGKKVLFDFAGTDEYASVLTYIEKRTNFSDDVVRVYFNGCQDPNIGGKYIPFMGSIDPNLDVAPLKIKTAFNETNKTLSLKKLKDIFKDSIIIEPAEAINDDLIEVDELNLLGFSRGAVTAFACARHLNSLQIPINIFARDPVPGDSRKYATTVSRSEYSKNVDLTNCDMIKSATIVLGTYISSQFSLHNKYFRQMIPAFNDSISKDVSVSYSHKKHHTELDYLQENKISEFLFKSNLTSDLLIYELSAKYVRLFPIPRVLQQKLHTSSNYKISAAEGYKNLLMENLNNLSGTIYDVDTSLKIAEADLAIYLRYTAEDALKIINLCHASVFAKAARDFLIETNAIMRLVLEEIDVKNPSNFVKAFIKKQNGDLSSENVKKIYTEQINLLLKEIDIIFINFLENNNRDLAACEKFTQEVKAVFNKLKQVLPSSNYNLADRAISKYLKVSPITNPGLDNFLDESETINPESSKTNNERLEKFSAKNVAYEFYHSSDKQRREVYLKYKLQFSKLLTNVEEIATVVQFLTPIELDELFSNPTIITKIQSVSDLNKIIINLRESQQRSVIFKKLDIKSLVATEKNSLDNILNNVTSSEKKKIIELVLIDNERPNEENLNPNIH